VAKADLGEKQLCPSCATKFYDLRKRPAVCPKCATAFDPGDETIKMKRVKAGRMPTYERDAEEEEELVDKETEDGAEEEVEETPELDADAVEAPVLTEDGEEEEAAASPDALPEGFSEEEADLEEEDAGPDAPLLDIDEDEEFSDEELLEEGGDDGEER